MASSRWFWSGRSWPKLVAAVGVVGLAISLCACGKEGEKTPQAAAPPPPPSPTSAMVVLVPNSAAITAASVSMASNGTEHAVNAWS